MTRLIAVLIKKRNFKLKLTDTIKQILYIAFFLLIMYNNIQNRGENYE